MFRSEYNSEYVCRIPELSPEYAAREIVSAVLHNKITVIVPHNLLFWQNVLKYVISKRECSRKKLVTCSLVCNKFFLVYQIHQFRI
jgi:hypothetical protein